MTDYVTIGNTRWPLRESSQDEDGRAPVGAQADGRNVVTNAFIASGSPLLFAGALREQATQAAGVTYDQVTNFRYGRYRDASRSQIAALGDIYDDADDQIFRITGQRLGNPLIADGVGDWFNREILSSRGSGTERYASAINDPRIRWHAELARLAASDPRLAEIQQRYGDPTRVDALADQLRQQVTREYHEYLGDEGPIDQIIRGILGAPGMIAGALSTGSPEQVGQLALGGAGRGMTLAQRAISGALTNTAGQALVEPILIEDARRMGEEYSSTQIALDFILAAGFGATVEVAGGILDAPADAPPIVRDVPPIRARVESLQQNIRTLAAGGGADQASIDRAAEQIFRLRQGETLDDVTLEEVPGGDIQRALTGQAESLIVSAYSRDAATVRTFPDPDETDPIALADYINAADRFINGESDQFPVETRPVRVADEAEISAARAAADDTPAPEPGTAETIRFNGQERRRTFMRFDPRELGADPETFQYKRSQGADGVTGVLEGVDVFDPASAGKVKVFEYADGRRVIADGHQRRSLARAAIQAGQENVWLDGYLYRAADGWTPREVRNLAAQKNLRETPGDPIDTAQLLREAPELIDSSIPQRSRGFRVAAGLSKLSDAAFAAVRAGVVDPRFAAIIGENASTRPEIHEPLMSMFQQTPPRSEREAAFIVHEAMQAELFRTQASQLSMFGDAPELSGMRERAEILRIAGNILRNDKRLFEVAARNAEALESAGNIIRKEENARRADAAEALLRSLDVLATRPSAVSRLLREVADTAAREKIKPELAADRFVSGLMDLLNERGLVGLLQERPPEIDPPRPIDTPMLPRLEEEARAADLLIAHDADREAFQQALAEVAVERALRGDMADMPEPDAIGHTPEADMRRIEAALDALGVDDPTVPDVALALYARPTPDMEMAARARLRGEAAGDVPATHAEVVEQNAKIEVWNPITDFDDEAKLIAAIENATIPQLDKIQRTFGLYGDAGEHSRTRAEFMSAFIQEWREANGVEPPPPVVPVKRPAPSSSEIADLIKRAARFVDREDAVQRYADARADLFDAIDRMGNKADKWLERAIEDAPFGSRKKVLRDIERARKGRFAIGDDAKARIADADPETVAEAFDLFGDKWETFTKAVELLQRETNNLPVGVTEPIQAIETILNRLEKVPSLTDSVIAVRAEWRAVMEQIWRENTAWFEEGWFPGDTKGEAGIARALDAFDGMFDGDRVYNVLTSQPEAFSLWYEDMQGILEAAAFDEDFAVSDELRVRAAKLLEDVPPVQSAERDAYSVVDAIAPEIAKLRRNIDELWDEWQSSLGPDADETTQAALKTADDALADAMAAFDGNPEAGEAGLRTYSRPRNVRFAIGDAAPRAPKNTVANVIRQLQREFPRYGKKLLERARVIVVQSVKDLPDGGRGFYAKLFGDIGTRQPMSDILQTLRTSEGIGFHDYYAWRSSAGKDMAAEVVSTDPRAPAIVNFGLLEDGGIRIVDAKLNLGLRNAIETLTMAMAAVDRDAAIFNRPSYRFSGFTPALSEMYDRMFDVAEPPPGYVKVRVARKGGIALIRQDVADANGFVSGNVYDQPAIQKLMPRTRAPTNATIEGKIQSLDAARFDAIAKLKETLLTPPRSGQFARGNGTIGYSEGGQAWLVADNLPPELVRGITLHEIGEHVGMPAMLGEQGYERFIVEVQKLYEAGDDDIVSGYNEAVAKGTPESQLWSEAAAYALTYADPNRMSDGFRGFIMKLINSVRAWVWRNMPWMMSFDRGLSFEDIQFLAMGALRHAANNNPRVIDVRSLPARLRDLVRPKPRVLADAVAEAESGWLPITLFHGKSGRPQAGMMFTTPHAKIAGIYGEIEAYEVRGPIFDASDDVVRTQDDFNRIVAEAQRSGANGVYIRALDRGKFGAQEQIVMFNGEAIRPAGSGRVDPNNPASVARAEAEQLDRVVTMLEHCR